MERDRFSNRNNERRDRYNDRFERRERSYDNYNSHERRREERYEYRSRYEKREEKKGRKEEEINDKETIMQQIEKERRTVFVRGLTTEASNEEIKEFFNQAGEVVHVEQVIDTTTKRSRGFGYVEFKSIEGAIKAIEMSGMFFKENSPIYVSESNAQQNRNTITVTNTQLQTNRIKVKNMNKQLSREDIEKVFGIAGKIIELEIKEEEESNNVMIEYDTIKMAKRAIELYDGRSFGNMKWEVFSICEKGNDIITNEDEQLLESKSKEILLKRIQGGTSTLFGQENINHYKALFVQNVFIQGKESIGFEKELRNDILEELKQYCQVKDVIIDLIHPKGVVYVLCETDLDAQKAFSVMHLRWFNMHLLRVEYYPESKIPIVHQN
ncbi:splicing factor, putative [Entamoeba dispar SAW760]|uniref:Splicing factor, putative n=1 Tax=Entamoeba dispar (strain ATCC PRA-260 / SAW760) TaxID=370354 RepID=B0E6V1_ENTDS|nr:splicing factor, putative [Entamoeba dispar SAW760]EDR29692.1 splicing factor, putative [Entamoeba dispar SAW760]|eukprot:EDR29692.1 splicing factor, putative [Entamoeba dispar SAW760]